MTLNLNQQRKYLDAMGIQVWLTRDDSGLSEDLLADLSNNDLVAADLVTTDYVTTDQVTTDEVTTDIEIIETVVPNKTESQLSEPSVLSSNSTPDWQTLESRVKNCTACELCKTRTQTVFGVGNNDADWLIIGEAPGAEEDRQGEPFVGPAGQLLTEMLRAIGLKREQVFIANILKCRPPNNRDPLPEEVESCELFLKQQIALIKPRVILAVGRVAAQNLLKSQTSIGKLRGQVYSYGDDVNTPLVVTYHPAYLLRSPLEKRKAWNDLKIGRAHV